MLSPYDCPFPAEPIKETKGIPWTIAGLAQLFCVSQFSVDFLNRYGGIVLCEKDHFDHGGSESTPRRREPSRIAVRIGHTNPKLERILDALNTDFRSFKGGQDWRKPDALAIRSDGLVGHLLEVTTQDRYHATRDNSHAAVQLRTKLEILSTLVNGQSGIATQWYGAPWRPDAMDFSPLPSEEGIKWICFRPTYREPGLEQGIALYEMHHLAGMPVPSPILLPERVRELLRQAAAESASKPADEHPLAWGQKTLLDHPILADELRQLLTVAGTALVVLAFLLAVPTAPVWAVIALVFAGALVVQDAGVSSVRMPALM